MTVSSTISVFCRDGVFRTVYCHLHGEPTWNGRILHTHYATGQQAEALVEHGDIRCLGPRCDKPCLSPPLLPRQEERQSSTT